MKTAGAGIHRDDKLLGFGLRVTPAGFKSFIVETSRVARFAFGKAHLMTVADARSEARRLITNADKGIDPQAERKAKRERSDTLQAQLDAYVASRSLKASTEGKYRDVLRRCVPDWLDKPIDLITPAMARLRYEELTKRSVAEANNMDRVLRAVCRRAMVVLPNKADGTPGMKAVPTMGINGARRTLARRSTLLEADETGAWLRGVDGLRSGRSSRALRALLLTGLRVQEALRLDWRDVDEGKRRLTIRDSKTGGFTKIIGPKLASLFATWRGDSRQGLVFGGVNDLRAALDSVEKAGGKLIMPHDLRRTYASFAERAGVPYIALKVLLNHATSNDVTAGYVRPSESDLLHWAGAVEGAILAAAEGGAVLPFARAVRS